MSTIREIFPPDDEVSRFVIAMLIASHDVENAVRLAGEANDTENQSFRYYVRLATAHAFEGVNALRFWRQESPDVQKFLKRLPPRGHEKLKRATGMLQKVGYDALEETRNRTFHYPYPAPGLNPNPDDQLRAAIDELGDKEAKLHFDLRPAEKTKRRVHFPFAQDIAAALAFGQHDPARLRDQVELARDGAIAFVAFVNHAWDLYEKERDLHLGEPEEPT